MTPFEWLLAIGYWLSVFSKEGLIFENTPY